MTLSAILTAQNMPLTEWSKQTFDNVLVQGDNMYLKALNSGLLILDDGVEVLSIDDLPTVVDVSFCRNMSNDFSYEICRSLIDHTIYTSPSVVINNDLPIIELPIEAQNYIELPVEAQNTIELPIEAQNTIELPVEAQNTIELPVEAQNIIELPVEAQNTIELPLRHKITLNCPLRHKITLNYLHVQPSPIMVTTSDLPIVQRRAYKDVLPNTF
jgi:hypothetical protein